MLYRALFLVCACASLAGCGNPIGDLAHEVKDLIPDAKADAAPGCPGQATTQVSLIGNLHADSAQAASWDAKRPEATSGFVVSVAPYTSEGKAVDLRIFFVRRAEHAWDWHVLANQAGERAELGTGALTFAEDGALRTSNVGTPLRLPLADGALSAPIALDLGAPASADADGFAGVTSTAEPSRLDSYEQDGRPAAAGACH